MNCFILSEQSPELALTVESNEEGANVSLKLFTGHHNQIFRVVNSLIISQYSQLVIDIDSTNGIQSGSGIVTKTPLKNDSQCFLFRPDGTILNPKFNLCLSPKSLSNGAQIIAVTPNGDKSQKFRCVTKKF